MIHISYVNTSFKCPYCNKDYNDENDLYVNRCNKNKSWCTSIKCKCGNKFSMTYNIMGDAVSFK